MNPYLDAHMRRLYSGARFIEEYRNDRGHVIRVYANRHQRFIVEITAGHTTVYSFIENVQRAMVGAN